MATTYTSRSVGVEDGSVLSGFPIVTSMGSLKMSNRLSLSLATLSLSIISASVKGLALFAANRGLNMPSRKDLLVFSAPET